MSSVEPRRLPPSTGIHGYLSRILRDPGSLGSQLTGAVMGSAAIRLLGVILGFLVGIQLARYLGPEQYGVYGIAVAGSALAATVAAFGIPLLVTREAASASARRDWAALNGLVRWSLLMVGGMSLIAALALAWLVSRSGHATDGAVAFWAGAAVPCGAMLMLIGALLRGSGVIVGGQSLDTILRPGLQGAVLLATFAAWQILDATTALIIFVGSGAAAVAAGMIWLLRAIPVQARHEPPRYDHRAWMRAALALGATTILNSLYAQLPLLIVGAIASAVETGVFRVALSSMVFASLPHTLLSFVAYPFASRLHAEGDKRRLQLLASWSALSLFASTLVISLLLYVWGESLIALLFGVEYRSAWLPLFILSGASVASAAAGIGIAVLHASGRDSDVTLAFCLAIVAGVGALALTVPHFGIAGAATSVAISAVVKAIVVTWFCRTRAGIANDVVAASVRIRRLSTS